MHYQKKSLQFIIFPLLTFIFAFNYAAYAQLQTLQFASGAQWSDVKMQYYENNTLYGVQCNRVRISTWSAVSGNLKVWKHLSFTATLQYEVKKPLEAMNFPMKIGLGILATQWFCAYPTTRNHPTFNSELGDVPLPSLRYLGAEMIVNYRLPLQKFGVEAGIGLFGRKLLNVAEAEIDSSDLRRAAFFFRPPFNVYGTFRHNTYDLGWVPQIAGNYQINDAWRLGILAKYYHSLLYLNDLYYDDYPQLSTSRMYWRSLYVGATLTLCISPPKRQ